MSEVSAPAPTPAPTPAARPSPGRVLVLCGAILIAAVLTRFWDLGSRPLHHDESIHAYQSLSLAKGADWRYDPAYHGPFLYYVNALVYKVFGATNTTARLMPALFGILLIAFALPLRRWIGDTAALAYALAILTSGHMAYFSRFIREDLYSLVFTLGTILAFQRFLETDRAKWLSLSAASFAFAGVTKENGYMTGVLFVAYGAWCLFSEALLSQREGGSLARPIRTTAAWIRERMLPIASAGILFLVIWITMYTGFGRHPEDWLAIPKAVKYWMGQHSIARIPGPWWYYFPQLAYYETAIGIAALFAFPWTAWRRDPFLRSVLLAAPSLALYGVARAYVPILAGHAVVWVAVIFALASFLAIASLRPAPERVLTPFLRFVAFWAVGSLGIYAWAREKVPWLTVHPLLPLTILAAIGFARLWRDRRRATAGVAIAAIALALAVNIGGMYLACFRYGAHDVEREPRHAEMLAYVQTTRDLIRALDVVDKAKDRVAPGQPVITAGGEASWPLTWYLRDVQTNWATRIESATTPIIVADWDPEGALEKQLAPQYDAKRVPIRAWWFPETRTEAGKFHPTVKELLRWWLFHEIWTPIGSQDTVFYVRKDLGNGSGPLPALNLQIQDMTSRDYPAEADALPTPARSFGSTGVGPGQLAEPRGVAVDGRGWIYVADTKNSRIAIFDGNGVFQRILGSKGSAEGQLNEPCGVVVGPDGIVYVADTWNHRIARFGAGGEPLPAWTDPEKTFFGPRAVVLLQGNLYVADTGNKRIARLDATGKVTASFGTGGGEPGQFVEPVGLAADAAGHLYVADTGNHRVQVFDAAGKFLRLVRVYGWKDFYTEPYLVAGPGDAIVVTDAWKGRLATYDAAGNIVHSFQYPELKRPTGITLDAFGRIVVTDRETGRVFVWGLSDLIK
ncbi:MAG TPA: flippase activity-associated protein Agl23 [Thermoanaerobaculia bacterium]